MHWRQITILEYFILPPFRPEIWLVQNISIRVDEPENVIVMSCPYRDRRKGLEREFSKVWTRLAWPKNCEMKHYISKETGKALHV